MPPPQAKMNPHKRRVHFSRPATGPRIASAPRRDSRSWPRLTGARRLQEVERTRSRQQARAPRPGRMNPNDTTIRAPRMLARSGAGLAPGVAPDAKPRWGEVTMFRPGGTWLRERGSLSPSNAEKGWGSHRQSNRQLDCLSAPLLSNRPSGRRFTKAQPRALAPSCSTNLRGKHPKFAFIPSLRSSSV